uniref:MADF domain-containing protein n=1 Tax=Heliothis virescens TaxID=7102 RepID=A0A2A4JH56_HELVI
MSAGKRKMTAAEGEGGEVGRLVDCSQADDRRMIRLVRERPLLYARNNMPVASYYSQVKKLWQEVADLMDWTVADVRRKWSHVRNSYSRHLRNEMYGVRTGRGRIVSRWYLADELDFLREHMATDTRPSRYSFPVFADSEAKAARPELPGLLASSWLTLGSTPHAAPLHLSGERADDTSSPHSFDPDENSAYFHFFRGIHNDYQELPAKKQRLFRRECLAFLHRLLDEEEPPGQAEAPASSDSADEPECKPCIVEWRTASPSSPPSWPAPRPTLSPRERCEPAEPAGAAPDPLTP